MSDDDIEIRPGPVAVVRGTNNQIIRLRTVRQLLRELDNAIAEVARVSGKRKTGLEIITHTLGEQMKDIGTNRMLDIEVEIKP